MCVIYHLKERSELYQTLNIAFYGSGLLLLKSDKKKRLSFFLDTFQSKVAQKESWILRKPLVFVELLILNILIKKGF
jgi:hypothetical protein